jgi:hypothetical protein
MTSFASVNSIASLLLQPRQARQLFQPNAFPSFSPPLSPRLAPQLVPQPAQQMVFPVSSAQMDLQ